MVLIKFKRLTKTLLSIEGQFKRCSCPLFPEWVILCNTNTMSGFIIQQSATRPLHCMLQLVWVTISRTNTYATIQTYLDFRYASVMHQICIIRVICEMNFKHCSHHHIVDLSFRLALSNTRHTHTYTIQGSLCWDQSVLAYLHCIAL